MPERSTVFNKVAVTAHPNLPQAIQEAQKIAEYLNQEGVLATFQELYAEGLRQRIILGEYELLIALGGDGTMLRAGHLCGPANIPILGINLGRFGFLMEIRQQQWHEFIPKLLAGDYWIERRMMLCARLSRADNNLGEYDVLNEVVIGRGEIVRPVQLAADVDNRLLTTYVADALIISTPTGSTAYALAAGGPILPPEMRTILLVPVAPHLSIDRAIVLAEGSVVRVSVHTDHQAVLCVDGQKPINLKDDDLIEVFTSDHIVQFIRFQDPGYFYRNLTPHMSQNPSIGNHR